MRKILFVFVLAFLSSFVFSSCGSTTEKDVPKTEQEIMDELNKSMENTSNDMSIDTTAKDSVVLK